MLWINLIKEFIMNHCMDIMAILLFLGLMVGLWVKGYKKQVRMIVYDLVVKAEQELGSGTGRIKYIRVTRWIYARMPWIVKAFVSEEELDGWIELAVQELKMFIKQGGNLLTYEKEHIGSTIINNVEISKS